MANLLDSKIDALERKVTIQNAKFDKKMAVLRETIRLLCVNGECDVSASISKIEAIDLIPESELVEEESIHEEENNTTDSMPQHDANQVETRENEVSNSLLEPSHRIEKFQSVLIKNDSSKSQLDSSLDDLHHNMGVDVWLAPKVEQVYVLDVEMVELNQKSEDGSVNLVARQVFDSMTMRTKLLQNLRKKKFSKTWWFKFKEFDVRQEDIQNILLACIPMMAIETRYSSNFKLVCPRREHDEMFTVTRAVGVRCLLGLVLGITESAAGHGQQVVMSLLLLSNGMDRSFSDKVLIQQLEWGDCAATLIQEVSVVIRFILRRHLHLSFDCEEHALARRKRSHGLQMKFSLGLQSKQKQRSCPKSWMFKFKMGSKPTGSFPSGDGAESFPILKLAAVQLLLWLQNNSKKMHIVSEIEKKKKRLCYKTWMFKYKEPLKRVQFLLPFDMEVLLKTTWVVQRIGEKVAGDVDITDANKQFKDREARLINQLLFSNERFQIKHKWRFKLLPLFLELEYYLDSLVIVTSYAQQFGESKVDVVARSLQERESMLLILKSHLLWAQHRMEQAANKKRSERSFQLGDMVYVKLQPYRQGSVVLRVNQKLAPKYYGPYKVVDKCGQTAYKLELPSSAKIHPFFHVSQLKLRVGDQVVSTQLPSIVQDVLIKAPDKILERRMVKRQGRAATQVLVKWVNEDESEATWEFLFDLMKKFPSFQP